MSEASCSGCECVRDDPETDATDWAHPAWWRGNDRGVQGAAEAILSVIAHPEGSGQFNSNELEAVRLCIQDLYRQIDESQKILIELYGLVKGESPGLLDEDSGGEWELDLRITTLLREKKNRAV